MRKGGYIIKIETIPSIKRKHRTYEEIIREVFKRQPIISQRGLIKLLGRSERTARRHIYKLKNKIPLIPLPGSGKKNYPLFYTNLKGHYAIPVKRNVSITTEYGKEKLPIRRMTREYWCKLEPWK